MPAIRRSTSRATRQRGLTLLEMVVVLAILAALAGGIYATIGDVRERAAGSIARAEMATLKRAVLRFRADTGCMPRTGRFDPASLDHDGPTEWATSPANWTQLLDAPRLAGDEAAPWDPDRARGWNGPYLDGKLYCALGAMAITGTATPELMFALPGIAVTPLADVPSLADPFDAPAAEAFSWRTGDVAEPPRHGAPYLLVSVDDPDRARIICFGPNGVYDGSDPAGDDIVLYLLK